MVQVIYLLYHLYQKQQIHQKNVTRLKINQGGDMPVTPEDIREFNIEHGIPDNIELLNTYEYRGIVNNEAYFYEDPHGFLMHTLSNQVIAKNTEQLDVIIEQLQAIRLKMSRPPKQLSEK